MSIASIPILLITKRNKIVLIFWTICLQSDSYPNHFGRYHPDKNGSNPEASELFKEVAYSYSILSDPEKRRQYDSAGFEVLVFLSPSTYDDAL